MPRTDPRLRSSRETALSVKILLERASAACTRNGVGYELLIRFYVMDESWHFFPPHEQRIIAKTAQAFSKALRECGFIEGK